MNQKLVLSGQDKSFKMNTHNVPIWQIVEETVRDVHFTLHVELCSEFTTLLHVQ
jgi:hypothetical protein